MADYTQITNDEFDRHLAEIVNELPSSALLTVPGVYEVLREHYNNAVLDAWAEENPDKAYADED